MRAGAPAQGGPGGSRGALRAACSGACAAGWAVPELLPRTCVAALSQVRPEHVEAFFKPLPPERELQLLPAPSPYVHAAPREHSRL